MDANPDDTKIAAIDGEKAARTAKRMPRRAPGSPPAKEVPVLQAGWPSGVALVDETSLSVLEALAEDPPSGSLVVLACEFADVSRDAGDMVARTMLGSSAEEDLHLAFPEGERWTVGEVEEIARRLTRYPRTRHVVLVDAAESLERRALDRLLLLLEEPPSPLLVLMVVPRFDVLPATIRGRAAAQVRIGVLSAAERVRALVSRGVGPQVAREAVELAGPRPSLAGPFASDAHLRDLARRGLSPEVGLDAVASSDRRVLELSTLAYALAAVRRSPGSPVELRERRYEDLDPASRVLFRELVHVWADHRRRGLCALLPLLPSHAMPLLERSLEEVSLLEERLRVPVGPALAFAACVASSPAV